MFGGVLDREYEIEVEGFEGSEFQRIECNRAGKLWVIYAEGSWALGAATDTKKYGVAAPAAHPRSGGLPMIMIDDVDRSRVGSMP